MALDPVPEILHYLLIQIHHFQNHIRRQKPSLMLYLLALLQPAPELLGNLLGPGPLHVKTSCAGDCDGVAVTQHIVVYPVSIYHIRAHLYAFPVLRKLHKAQFKGQFRRNGAQRSAYLQHIKTSPSSCPPAQYRQKA